MKADTTTHRHLKQLVSESFIYGLSSVVSKFLYVILIPIYTRMFLPEDYGVMSLVTNSMALVAIFVVLGLDTAAARWFYDTEESGERKRVIATWTWCQIVFSLLFACGIALFGEVLSNLLISRQDAAGYFRLAAAALPLTALSSVVINWLRLQRRPWATISFSIGTNVLSLGLTIYFVAGMRWGLKGVYLAQLLAAAFSAVTAAVLLRDWANPVHFEHRLLRKMMAFSLPLIPASLSYWVVNLSGLYFIKGFSSTSEVGLYQVGSSIASAMGILTAAFQQAWGPFALSIHREENAPRVYADVLTAYVLTTCFLGMCLSLFAPEILSFLTTRAYLGASRVVGILAFNYVVIGVTYIAAIGSTIARTTKPYGVAVVCASLLIIVLNCLFVPQFGKEGAAISTLIAQSLVPVYLFYYSQKIYPIPYRFAAAAETFFLALAVSLASAYLSTGSRGIDIALKAGLVLGVMAAVFALRITTPEKLRSLAEEFSVLRKRGT